MRIVWMALLLSLSAAQAPAAPISAKELDLMVRLRVPEADILRAVSDRRLLAPIDPVLEGKLSGDGASKSLIGGLKDGRFVLDPAAAARAVRTQEQARTAAVRQSDADTAAAMARTSRQAFPDMASMADIDTMSDDPEDGLFTIDNGNGGPIIRLHKPPRYWICFADDLQRLDASGRLVPFKEANLIKVQYFLLYFSSASSVAGRSFTPQLVAAYNRLKPLHPELEVIFMSSDQSAAEMHDYMRLEKMPWLAVKFERVPFYRKFRKPTLPWLAIIDGEGNLIQAIHGKDPDGWVEPSVPLGRLTKMLGG